MARKSSMQKEVERTEKTEDGVQEPGEQLDLIDVQPENAKAIIEAARLYKKYQVARLKALSREIAQKQRTLELVRAAEITPLEGGKIKFEYDNVVICVTPRNELITVKEKTGPEGEQLAHFTD